MWGFYSYLKFKPSESNREGFFSSTPQRLSERRKQWCKSLLPDKRPTQHPDWQVQPPTHSPTHPPTQEEGRRGVRAAVNSAHPSFSQRSAPWWTPATSVWSSPCEHREPYAASQSVDTYGLQGHRLRTQKMFPYWPQIPDPAESLSWSDLPIKNTVIYAKTLSQFD